jgi:hypothetical protein
MDIIVPKEVHLKHDSILATIKAIIISKNDDAIKIKVRDEFTGLNMRENDELILLFNEKNMFTILKCTVIEASSHSNYYELKLVNSEVRKDKRKHKRYPVTYDID